MHPEGGPQVPMNPLQPLQFSSEPSSREEDERLLRLAQGGDEDAFGQLVERHQARAVRVARSMVGSEEDAQDVAQEAFLRVYRGMERFDYQYAFSTWLYRIVTNLCIDLLRKRRRHQSLSVGTDGEAESFDVDLPDPSEALPSDGLIALETAGEVRAVLDGLAPHFRTALVLRELEGLSCKEIADIVGATHVTVRWRLHRGRKLFMDAWKRRQEGGLHPAVEDSGDWEDSAGADSDPNQTSGGEASIESR